MQGNTFPSAKPNYGHGSVDLPRSGGRSSPSGLTKGPLATGWGAWSMLWVGWQQVSAMVDLSTLPSASSAALPSCPDLWQWRGEGNSIFTHERAGYLLPCVFSTHVLELVMQDLPLQPGVTFKPGSWARKDCTTTGISNHTIYYQLHRAPPRCPFQRYAS